MPKINLFFTEIPVVVMPVLIGVLDFRTVLVLQFSDNTYRLSLGKWVPGNLYHSDGPMKTFLTCAAEHSRCRKARNRNQQNYCRFFLFNMGNRNAKAVWPRKRIHAIHHCF